MGVGHGEEKRHSSRKVGTRGLETKGRKSCPTQDTVKNGSI